MTAAGSEPLGETHQSGSGITGTFPGGQSGIY